MNAKEHGQNARPAKHAGVKVTAVALSLGLLGIGSTAAVVQGGSLRQEGQQTAADAGAASVNPAVAVAYAAEVPASNANSSESATSGTVTPAVGSASASKKEVVYSKLDAAGNALGVYVVNILSSAEDTAVIDYGDYENVTNLTDNQNLGNGTEHPVRLAAGEDFYYQGDLATSAKLPWALALSYRLDGQPVTPDELGGASGHLAMTLAIHPSGGAMADFSDAYLLQVTGTFAGDKASGITASGATLAQSGGDTKLSYMVFPGKSASYTIEADVRDFAFDGWTIAGVPLSIALDTSDVDMDSSKLKELEEAISSLDAGVAKLSSGAMSAQQGIDLLASKSSELAAGSSEAYSGIQKLSRGSRGLALQVSNTLVPRVERLAAGSQTYYDALGTQADGARAAAAQVDVAAARASYEQAFGAYMAAYTACLQSGGDPTADASVLAALGTMQQALGSFVTAQSTQAGYASAAQALDVARDGDGAAANGYTDINDALQGVVDPASAESIYVLQGGTDELANNLEVLESEYALIDSGTGSLGEGLAALSSKFADLRNGSGTLAAGTQELVSKTTGLDQQLVDSVREELSAYLNPDFKPRSFVSVRNTGVQSTQFVYMTAAIEAGDEDSPTQITGEPSDADKGVAARFLALFGLA